MSAYVTIMCSPPAEEEEPSEAQLAALHRKTFVLKGPPYADLAIFTPFGRKCLKAQKFRVYHPLGDGSHMMRELPGSQNFQQWLTSWRVYKVACLMLSIASLASLQIYEKAIERLVLQWPNVGVRYTRLKTKVALNTLTKSGEGSWWMRRRTRSCHTPGTRKAHGQHVFVFLLLMMNIGRNKSVIHGRGAQSTSKSRQEVGKSENIACRQGGVGSTSEAPLGYGGQDAGDQRKGRGKDEGSSGHSIALFLCKRHGGLWINRARRTRAHYWQ